uniref:Serpin family D member 1 n=1 Tax=Meleagris gallopavo TaxID=9103 RepID=A0A803YCH0_MELGA
MKFLFRLLALVVIITSTFCGIKDFSDHFESLKDAHTHENGTYDMPDLPLEFHRENTITNDLIPEEEEEEDYLDLDKILGEDDYSDVIDAAPHIVSEIQQGNILELFQGKTRIQRLNILNANFGFNLYRSVADKANSSDNILMAPVGISTAMAMISLGLKGQTQQEVLSVLGFEDFINASTKYELMTVHNLFRKLTHRLFRRNFGYTLRSVNDLYIHPNFITKTNERILKLTKGLIKEALVNVNPTTLMMILNCLYFKGTWENKFPVEMTTKRSFRLNEKQTIKVPMMQTKGNFLAAADPEMDCGVIQLPFVGNISMLIVLPHKLSGMKALEKQITPQVVEKWQKSMTNRTREVVLPKFKLEKNYNLIGFLRSMGIEELFSEKGNYCGVSEEKVSIDRFNHQGTITVNEEGTEAGAITNVGFMPLSTQIRFIVDRPFLFLIYEHRTSCLLFMAQLASHLKN